MKIALMVHARRADAVSHARRIARRLLDAGVQVLAESDAEPHLPTVVFSVFSQRVASVSGNLVSSIIKRVDYCR